MSMYEQLKQGFEDEPVIAAEWPILLHIFFRNLWSTRALKLWEYSDRVAYALAWE